MRKGFTLVELSIVLVIIGILAGGIMIGKTMINKAKMQALISDLAKYDTAVNTFKQKYYYYPGDSSTAATDLWSTTTNGDGGGTVNTSTEATKFWQQLSLSQMLQASYDGSAFGSNYTVKPDTNVPRTPVDDSAIAVDYNNNPTAFIIASTANSNALSATVSSTVRYYPILTPRDAYAIDLKMDDGYITTGRVQGGNSNTSSASPLVLCTMSTTQYDTTSNANTTCVSLLYFFYR